MGAVAIFGAICFMIVCCYRHWEHRNKKLQLESQRINSESHHNHSSHFSSNDIHTSKFDHTDTNLVMTTAGMVMYPNHGTQQSDTYFDELFDLESPLTIQNTISNASNASSIGQLTVQSSVGSSHEGCDCNGYDGIQNCIVTQRIVKIMKKFEKWHKSEMRGDINMLFENEYDINSLKNDYNAVILNHSDEASFAYIHDAIVDEHNDCFLSQCAIFLPFTLNTYLDDYKGDTFILSIFYSMHCNFLHSYDLGYRIKPDARESKYKTTFDLDDDDHAPDLQEIDDIIDENEEIDKFHDRESKNRRFSEIQNIVRHKRNSSHQSMPDSSPLMQKRRSKFVTDVVRSNRINSINQIPLIIREDQEEEEEKQEQDQTNGNNDDIILEIEMEDQVKEKKEEKVNAYGFGIRWYYWKKYRQSAFYVTPKFSDFKTELLQNNICSLDIQDWDAAFQSAAQYIETQKAKKTKCNGSPLMWYYGIEKNTTLSLNHLLSMVIYCNYDNLQFQYSKTFRKTEEIQDRDEIKKQNSQFCHWSKLLRETVEIFGTRMRSTPNVRFYHGISCELLIPTTISKFNGPTSLTTELAVAASFSDGNGLILELSQYGLDCAYFNCSWISRYSSEQERVICGGYQPLKISSIMLTRLEHDYRKYIKAINIIQSLISDKYNCEYGIKKPIKRIISAFLRNKKSKHSMPEYVQKLWKYFCLAWKQEIIICVPYLNNSKFYKPLKNMFFDKNNEEQSWINLKLIHENWINAPKITIKGCYGNDGIVLNENTMNRLLSFCVELNDNESGKQLNQIQFYALNECTLKCQDAVKSWKTRFENIDYILSCDIDNDGINSIFITKTEHVTLQ